MKLNDQQGRILSAANSLISSLPPEALSHIFHSITDGLLLLDRNWVILYLNEKGEQDTGLAKESVIGKCLWEAFADARELPFYQYYRKAFETNQSITFEAHHERKGKWFECSAYPSQDYLVVIHKDISERKKLQRLLQENNEIYTHLFRASSEAVFDWRIGDDKVFWHGENLKKIFGYVCVNDYTPYDLWESNVHPADREWVLQSSQKTLLSEATSWEGQYWFRKACGTYAFVKDRGVIIRDNEGKAVRVVGAITDITAQKRAEEHMLQSEQNYRSLFENAPLPTWIFDVETLAFLKVNDAACVHYGYTKKEFQGMTLWDLRPEEYREEFKNKHLVRVGNGKKFNGYSTHVKKNGQVITVEISSSAVRYKGRKARLVSVNDLTGMLQLQQRLADERVAHERAISQASIAAQEKERAFIGKELHDNINQILTSTKLYLELAEADERMRPDLIGRCRGSLESAIKEVQSLSRALVSPLLSGLSFKNVLEQLVEPYRLTQAFTTHLQVEGPANQLPDNIKLVLFRAIQEQLTNITKYAGARNVWLQLSCTGEVELEIRDDGRGFDATLKRSGIGLRNIQNRVTVFNGTLQIITRPGEGCTLKMNIPIKKNHKKSTAPDWELSENPGGPEVPLVQVNG